MQTDDGMVLVGAIQQENLSDAAAVVLFALEHDPGPIIVPLERIVTIRER